jgi:hypothetical protein
MVTTSTYNAVANSCTSLLITARNKSYQFVFTSCFLLTDPNDVFCLSLYRLADVSQLTRFKSKLLYDWGLPPVISSWLQPLETHGQRFIFSTEPLQSYPLCNILSDERMCLCREYAWLFIGRTRPLLVQALQNRYSQSHVTTDGQSASLSWNKAPIWDLRPGFYYCQTVAGLLMWGALFHERTGLSFTIAPGPCQCRHFRVRLPWDS